VKSIEQSEIRIKTLDLMNQRLGTTMYGPRDPSLPPRIVLTAAHLAGVLVVAWLLVGDGIPRLAHSLGVLWLPGDLLRRELLLICAVVYFLRLLLTVFVFLKRRVTWAETWTIVPWILAIHSSFALLGGTNTAPLGWRDWLALALYAAGSYLNTGSEWSRHLWKQRPENQGRLYTRGLFRLARHINYFGDLTLFSGYALLAGRIWAGIVPVLMLAGFVFVNIPALDSHLREKYAEDFEPYARRTKKLIPYVY
jgi:protein-S-isoprenylcysteine O-methyltransferase Ste14